jgi:hypothetical protein
MSCQAELVEAGILHCATRLRQAQADSMIMPNFHVGIDYFFSPIILSYSFCIYFYLVM